MTTPVERGAAIRADTRAELAPPGVPMLLFVGVPSLALLELASEPLPDLGALLLVLALVMVAALAWPLKLALALALSPRSVRRGWRRWTISALLLCTMFALVVTGAPLRARVMAGRPAMDTAASRAMAGQVPEGARANLGLFGATYEGRRDGSEVFLVGYGLNEVRMLVFVPEGAAPRPGEDVRWEHLDGNWWLEASSTPD